MSLDVVAESTLESLKKLGVSDSQVRVTSSEIHELELVDGVVNLCRTNTNQNISIKAVHEQRQTQVSSNRWDESAKDNLFKQLQSGLAASSQDSCYGIYKSDLKKDFVSDMIQPDMETLMLRIREFAKWAKEHHPKVKLDASPFQFVKVQTVLTNSHGMVLKKEDSNYNYSLMFTGKDGKKTGSFNFFGNTVKTIPKKISDCISTDMFFDLAAREVNALPLVGEMPEDIILSPFVIPGFIDFFFENLSTFSLMSGTSNFDGKLGEKVLSDQFTLRSAPSDPRFASLAPFSSDGVVFKEGPVFEKGVLKTYLLDVYGSRKLKQNPSEISTSNLSVVGGSQDFNKMLKGVKRGLLLMRFSGGHPSANGDFSGVAKNSFLIENGEITQPLKETMISGNLFRLFSNIQGISKDALNFGNAEYPWIHSRN